MEAWIDAEELTLKLSNKFGREFVYTTQDLHSSGMSGVLIAQAIIDSS
jgi:hypothetical protein